MFKKIWNKITDLNKIIKNSPEGQVTENITKAQDFVKHVDSIDKKINPPKEAKKDQKDARVKILSSGVNLDNKIIDKTFKDSRKNKKNDLNNRILKVLGIDKESLLVGSVVFGGASIASALVGNFLPVGVAAVLATASLAIRPALPFISTTFKGVGLTAQALETSDIINEYNNLPGVDGKYFIDKDGEKYFSPSSYVSKQLNKHKNQNPYDKLRNSGKKYFDEYNVGVIAQEKILRAKYGITDKNVNIFQIDSLLNNMTVDELIDLHKIKIAEKLSQELLPMQGPSINTRPEPKFKHPELASGEIQGKFGNMNTQTNTTKKKKTNKPSFWNRFSSNQYVNISREELRAKYKAHRAREIQNDPSMEYFYSTKYQDEHQNMFGTISCSNINPSEAHNFSSPVGGSFTSPFSSLSNEIAPFKIPPFLTIDDILRNPKFKEFAQNIAGNEAHKQLCSYDRELHESFQEESPLSDEDRSTMEDAHDLIAYINR